MNKILLRRATIPTTPSFKSPAEKVNGVTCGSDAAGIPIICSISFSCVTKSNGLPSCQSNTPPTHGIFTNTTTNTASNTSSRSSTSTHSPSCLLSSCSTSTRLNSTTAKSPSSYSPAISTAGSGSRPGTSSHSLTTRNITAVSSSRTSTYLSTAKTKSLSSPSTIHTTVSGSKPATASYSLSASNIPAVSSSQTSTNLSTAKTKSWSSSSAIHTTVSESKPTTASHSLSISNIPAASSSPTGTVPYLTRHSSFTTSISPSTTKVIATASTRWHGSNVYSSLDSCTTNPSINPVAISDPATPPTNSTLQEKAVLPIMIVMPSFFLVVCAIAFSIISNKHKWISRVFQARRLRNNSNDSSPAPIDPIEDPIPLRDLHTPPPAYSPYHFSQEDREWLGVATPRGGVDEMEGPMIESDMMGHAYPLGDRWRHRST